MHGFLWFLQIILALIFAAAGALKLSRPKQSLQGLMAWVGDYPDQRVRQIGALEVAAALGLVLPGWTGILPWLTPLAATGLVVLLALASLTHYRRGEDRMILVTVILAVLAGVVAVFRFGPQSW
jgi:hypothetical protein